MSSTKTTLYLARESLINFRAAKSRIEQLSGMPVTSDLTMRIMLLVLERTGDDALIMAIMESAQR